VEARAVEGLRAALMRGNLPPPVAAAAEAALLELRAKAA
jgi:hypothetical protein